MNFVVTENTIGALTRLQSAIRELLESLEPETRREPEEAQDLTVYAVPQANPGEARQGSLENGMTVPCHDKRDAKLSPAATLDEVREVLCGKAREGKTAMVKMLLERFGAASLSDVDPADYTELLRLGKEL